MMARVRLDFVGGFGPQDGIDDRDEEAQRLARACACSDDIASALFGRCQRLHLVGMELQRFDWILSIPKDGRRGGCHLT